MQESLFWSHRAHRPDKGAKPGANDDLAAKDTLSVSVVLGWGPDLKEKAFRGVWSVVKVRTKRTVNKKLSIPWPHC